MTNSWRINCSFSSLWQRVMYLKLEISTWHHPRKTLCLPWHCRLLMVSSCFWCRTVRLWLLEKASESTLPWSWSKTAWTMGTIMAVVAVLLIHMDKKAVTPMNPNINLGVEGDKDDTTIIFFNKIDQRTINHSSYKLKQCDQRSLTEVWRNTNKV